MTLTSAILTMNGTVVLDRFPESTIEMDGRDRDPYPRYDDRPPRLRSSSTSNSRRGGQAGFSRFDDDLELSNDPPSWRIASAAPAARHALRPHTDRATARHGGARRTSHRPVRRRAGVRAGGSRRPARRADAGPGRRPVRSPPSRLASARSRRPSDDQRGTEDLRAPTSAPTTSSPSRSARVRPDGPATVEAPVASRPTLPQQQIRAVGTMLARSSQDAGALPNSARDGLPAPWRSPS
jgi:hypothetical protein